MPRSDPAFWAASLYDDEALGAALETGGGLDHIAWVEAMDTASRRGLDGSGFFDGDVVQHRSVETGVLGLQELPALGLRTEEMRVQSGSTVVGQTLHDLAAEYGVSAERIRQIEVAAMKKMRKAMEAA